VLENELRENTLRPDKGPGLGISIGTRQLSCYSPTHRNKDVPLKCYGAHGWTHEKPDNPYPRANSGTFTPSLEVAIIRNVFANQVDHHGG